MEMFSISTEVLALWVYTLVKTHLIIQLKHMHKFPIHKFFSIKNSIIYIDVFHLHFKIKFYTGLLFNTEI